LTGLTYKRPKIFIHNRRLPVDSPAFLILSHQAIRMFASTQF
jgi:hypothetical protein